MYGYCQNMPVRCSDVSGHRPVSELERHGEVKIPLPPSKKTTQTQSSKPSKSSKSNKSNKKKAALVSSNGVYGSVNVGAFVLTGSVTLAVDTKGNAQVQYSFGYDVSTSGSLSASVGMINNYCIAPDISTLLGDAYSIGGGYAAHLPKTPIVLTKSGSIFKSGDGYMGVTHASGIAISGSKDISAMSLAGAEFHGGYSCAGALTPAVNVFELIGVPFV